MTIIVGLRCRDGVIIASDSQQEFGRGVAVKRLNTGKIYSLNKRFAIAGAGTMAHIEKAVDAIELGLREAKKQKGGVDLNEDECIDAIEKSITAVYKEYNIDRSKFLGDPGEREFFKPILIVGGIESADTENNVCLFIVHSEGIVERIPDYATAGSGAAYAELLLKNYYSGGMKMEEATPLAAYTIEEVKSIDPNCGGYTRITLIDPNKGVSELSRDKIIGLYVKVGLMLDTVATNLIPRILRGEIDENKLEKILEK